MTSTTHQFDVHQNIIFDVIAKQAGSRGKSILEGLMNAVDAGAGYVEIRIDEMGFRITDDGKGMDEQEILTFFKTFGHPHEENDALHGRFRIGRGQMMIWGPMEWSTNSHDLFVDFKNRGLDFDMSERAEPMNGTDIRVMFYEPLSRFQLMEAEREIKSLSAYTIIPVYMNGEQINTLPGDMKWDVETDRYWIRFKSSSGAGEFTEFYSQGSFVCTKRTGVSALVLTKPGHAFSLNMARNQILENEDPMYEEIMGHIRQKARQASTSRTRQMNDNLRREILTEIGAGEYTLGDDDRSEAAKSLRGRATFVNALGKGVAPSKLDKNSMWCIAPQRHAPRADQLIQKGVIVLDPILLEWAGVSDRVHTRDIVESEDREAEQALAERFVETVFGLVQSPRGLTGNVRMADWPYRPDPSVMDNFECYNTAAEQMTGDHEALNYKDLTKKEQAVIVELRPIANRIAGHLKRMARNDRIDAQYEMTESRQIEPGQSDSAHAWTDGESTIWINRKNLRIATLKDAGFLVNLLVHEYIHQGPTNVAHDHDMAFYETFHEVLMCESGVIAELTKELIKDYEKRLRKRGLKVSQHLEGQSRMTDELPEYAEQ